MGLLFARTLRRLRTEKGLLQRDLAERMYVTRSTVARWENGSRMPDAATMSRLATCLGVDVSTLLLAGTERDEAPHVIMVDDRRTILAGGVPVIESVMPGARVTGFIRPSEAVEYARENRVDLAFLDIEMGRTSGLELCRTLLEIHPRTNVVYLTAYSDYAMDAWDTGASGYMLKPLTAEGVLRQLGHLRYPFFWGGEGK